jgi:hypothetical protein
MRWPTRGDGHLNLVSRRVHVIVSICVTDHAAALIRRDGSSGGGRRRATYVEFMEVAQNRVVALQAGRSAEDVPNKEAARKSDVSTSLKTGYGTWGGGAFCCRQRRPSGWSEAAAPHRGPWGTSTSAPLE